MTGPERRQTPRTTMEKHAYINIEPNNGGIVLNVSDGGLCFYSYEPVPRTGPIRFWLSDHNQRIDADGTLAWTDETQKGGLRFNSLPAEAREKIRDWISHPSMPLAADERSAATRPRPLPVATSNGAWPDSKVVPAASIQNAVIPPGLKVRLPLSGFSRGLATGLLVSAVVVAVLLFHDYRREVGESLIELGKRFAAPETHTLTVSAASPAVSPPVPPSPSRISAPTKPAVSPPKVLPAASSVSVPPPEKLAPQPVPSPAKLQPAKLAPTIPINAASTTAGDSAAATPAAVAAVSIFSNAPSISAPVTAQTFVPAATGAPSSSPSKLDAAPNAPPANQPGVHTEGSGAENSDSIRELYFEVGKFKNVSQAHDETDKLAQLGFPATAVAKGHLWTNSFHVLVGPFGDEERAKETHETLVSSGFKPRPFEKGWRSFTLLSSVTLNGARTPEGDYTISWESYIGDASVKFIHRNSVVATAEGKWVKREAKYPRDAYVYRRNMDGSRTLLEIHFGGMRQALVFGKAS